MSRSHSTYVRTAAFLLYVILLHIGQKGEGRLHASSFAATSSASSPACFKNVVRTWRADWRERERIVPSPWALSAMSSTITFYVWNAMEKTSFESLFTVFFFSRGRETTRQTRQGSIFPQSQTVTRFRCVPPGVCLLGGISRQQTGAELA